MFLEIRRTYYERQITLLNIVFLGVCKLEMSKLSLKGKLEKVDNLSKSNPLKYMIHSSKIKS